MIIEYGNIVHISSILLAIVLVVILTLLLRKSSGKTKKIVILSILLVNLFQHIFKCIVWPQYYGTGFGELNSAYNMCAFLIIVSPLIFILKVKVFKDFIFYIGTTAGILAISVPYWFIGQSILTWEYLRFYVCHSLLFIGSILPISLGLHKISLKNVWAIGLCCLVSVLIVLGNGFIFSYFKYKPDMDLVMKSFLSKNPVWALHPSEGFEGIAKIITIFTPKIFLGGDGSGYTPILWYLIPMYLLITILVTLVALLFHFVIYKNHQKDGLSK